MSKLNKEQVISKFSELKDSKVDDKAFDRFDDHKWLRALDILFAKWIDDTRPENITMSVYHVVVGLIILISRLLIQ